ncbi:hypothetical protein SLEP1_g12236 [Rubroshorea leprosula]|uniref:Uncharacterized protein n=1 Tax=Rubroshorea leprosula TaxID=152421 RepID=A0AAV5IN80_9ROSI|nr:hypothetical protein SLEP1_g12236 [Rubroshorea leprosula]
MSQADIGINKEVPNLKQHSTVTENKQNTGYAKREKTACESPNSSPSFGLKKPSAKLMAA